MISPKWLTPVAKVLLAPAVIVAAKQLAVALTGAVLALFVDVTVLDAQLGAAAVHLARSVL